MARPVRTDLPLTDDERSLAAQVGRRLRSELGALILQLPPTFQTASGLEKVLGIHRAVSHRFFTAVRGTEDDLALLARLPGVEGLRQCLAAAREKLSSAPATVIASAEAAIESYAGLIAALGGSQARLISRLQAVSGSGGNGGNGVPRGRREDLRQTLFETISELYGFRIACRSRVTILRENPDRPKELEYVHARVAVGYRSPGLVKMPLVQPVWFTSMVGFDGKPVEVRYCSLDNVPFTAAPAEGLLEEFCTKPLPLLTANDIDGRLVQVIDPRGVAEENNGNGSFDVAIAYRISTLGILPSLQRPPIHDEVILIREPVERMVADVYLHRSLMRGCTPSLSVLMGRGGGSIPDRWYDRVEGAPLLSLLGRGLTNVHSATWSRHGEFIGHVFERLGWDPYDFVGFRCDESYPIWGAEYVMSFDYGSEASGEA
ncbi:MAG TPA: hypothetical protein VK176_02740 [Phycisphaerales bacterium]|nr:hypothetical protein [Phycisphaerales bacterium]